MHTYIIGATRSGKTNHMLSLASGAFCFIDKHGEAARQIADAMDCIYWRPADLSHIISLNPLQDVKPDDRWKRTAEMVSIFSDIWKLGPETPRLLYYLRASVRLLLDSPGSTVLHIRRLLSDDRFRAHLLRRGRDKETQDTWSEFNTKKEQQQAIEISSLQNKVAALADPLPLRYILGQPTSTIDIARVMRSGVPLVLDLSDLGDEPAALLGAIVINQLKQCAETVRQPYDLYIDEFQNFGTSIISTILSESGKFGLSLTLAHQFISQLEDEIRDAVLGNCSTIISFRIGAKDAPIIANAIDWSEQDLQDLPRGKARCRTLVNGRPTSAYLMETEKTVLTTGRLAANIRNTRANFARPRSLADHPKPAPSRKREASW